MEHYENLSLLDLKEYVKGVGWVYENWKDVKGYEGYYAVSTFGRVRSYSRMVWQPQTSSYVRRKERILKQKKCSDGYLAVTLSVNKAKKYTVVHRLVALMFVVNLNDKPEVNHIFGNKKQNRPDKLEWVTDKENTHHAIKNKLAPSMVGEENSRAILTEKQVIEIRGGYKYLKRGEKKEFAKKFPVSQSVVQKVAYGALWKHLKM